MNFDLKRAISLVATLEPGAALTAAEETGFKLAQDRMLEALSKELAAQLEAFEEWATLRCDPGVEGINF